MFLPWPGTLSRMIFPPAEQGLRIDSGVRQGDRITPYFDPMLAKLISHGNTRDEAILRMQTALAAVDLGDFISNLGFLAKVLAHPDFQAGRALTNFVELRAKELV